MEDDSKSNNSRSRTSHGSHMSVTFNSASDVTRKFCMKQNNGKQTYWPEGIFLSIFLYFCL